MSLCEWLAALDGYLESQGVEPGEAPATSEDLATLERYREPSGSIRR